MHEVFSPKGETKKCIQNFGQKTLKEETSWEAWGRWEYNTEIDLKKIMMWSGSE
jgi:hypothetical protein